MRIARPNINVGALQPLGRALMLPIAVLPVAGLLLRLGQPDMLSIPFVAAAGEAIFHNLGLLFAVGVAVGFAKDGNGAAGLAGMVCFLSATRGAEALIAVPASALAGMAANAKDLAAGAFKDGVLFKLSAPIGILSGLIAGALYNRFGTIKLPDFLAFFGGRRFVPIISGFAGLAMAIPVGLGWSALSEGIDGLGKAIVAAGPFGLFAYGFLNRLLIVTGLHNILNTLAWFIIGDFHGVTGDLNRFFAGDPTAGGFMSGFFPVMMFGLPAACLAMYHTARPERRAAVGGMLLSLALTAALTGVTEPVEFSFMFLAPALYLAHAIMTGLSMVLMSALHVRLGFTFSAGLFDYLINFPKASRPLMLIPVGLAYFGLYYGVFRFAIVRFGLKTPGREDEAAVAPSAGPVVAGGRGPAFVHALGGAGNLREVDACTTRLRLVVADQGRIDEAALRSLGARGFVRLSDAHLQVVVGPIADEVARDIRSALASSSAPPAPTPHAIAGEPTSRLEVTAAERRRAAEILSVLGGRKNLRAVAGAANRLLLLLDDEVGADEAALIRLGARGLARTGAGKVQVLLSEDARPLAAALAALA
ncbi:MAG: N-acetylglucosamine-specific PTS transporter subunit IIBC [Caulobacteraceae bacterium]